MFQPKILQPTPDPVFIHDLHFIDPDLRVVWGQERYIRSRWVIERKIGRERYLAMYASLWDSGEPRFVDQPIFDTDQPMFVTMLDETGTPFTTQTGYKQVGTRRFDLAPEYEWVQTIEEPGGAYRPLDNRTIMALKRAYAWERFHSFTRMAFEMKQAEEEQRERQAKQNVELCMNEIMEHRRELQELPFVGQPDKVMAGTKL